MKEFILSGEWTLENESTALPARVPGDITDDLTRAGKIADPYVGYQYNDCLWVQKSDWVYSKRFTAPAATEGFVPYLIFEGIDTYADVYLNGKHVGSADSMFRPYAYDVSGALLPGENFLEVRMRNVFGEMPPQAQDKYLSIFHANRIFVRKAQCHFGWDWAPRFGGYGIYRDVKLAYRPLRRIEDVFVHASDDGIARFRVTLDGRTECTLVTEIFYDGVAVARDERTAKCKRLMYNVFIKDAKLWYPNGYGEASLYRYRVTFTSGEYTDTREGTFGCKRVRLLDGVRDADSLDFGFEINGRAVYARGSNWVPADCMTGRLRESNYRALLTAAKEAGFNMLRVWGGGIYESDDFYDLCDELGIMVWQDFMFACAEIPEDDPAFTQKIIDEATTQVVRLRNHPCITYWCGMNENRGAFCPETEERYSHFTTHYLLRGIVADLDGHIPYGRTSPYAFGDIENEKSEGDSHDNLSEPCLLGASFKGFEHFDYAVGDTTEAIENRVRNYHLFLDETKCNFSSECAVLGMCSARSLRKFTPESERTLDPAFWESRFLGNPYSTVMPTFYERQTLLARATYGEISDIYDLAKKCGRVQADIVKSEILFARGNGRSHGILTWMYDDTWPTGTWSVVDYYGDKKPAYYAMKRYYAPKFAALDRRKRGVTLIVVNDGAGSAVADLTVTACRYDGSELHREHKRFLIAENERRENAVTQVEQADYYYVCGTLGDQAVRDIYEASRYLGKAQTPRFTATSMPCGDDLIVTIRAHTYVPCVRIAASDGAHIDDNYFDMAAGETVTVTVRGNADANLTVESFADKWDT